MYNVRLINYDFDSAYENVRLFSNKNERDSYFTNSAIYSFIINNFLANDLISTDLVLNYNTAMNLAQLLNCNYCQIQDVEKNIYYYFWVENIRQLSGVNISLKLNIDVFQTYIYDVTFSKCLIERAHLDRFVNSPFADNKFVYNSNFDSKLFKYEQMADVEKFTRYSDRLQLNVVKDNSNINKWLNDNVECWAYYYMSDGSQFGSQTLINIQEKILYSQSSQITYDSQSQKLIIPDDCARGASLVYVAPIMKTNESNIKIKAYNVDDSIAVKWNTECITNKLGDDYSKVYTIKYSQLPPFLTDNYGDSLRIIDNDDGTQSLIISFNSFTAKYGDNNLIHLFISKSNGQLVNCYLDYIQTVTTDGIPICLVLAQDMSPISASFSLDTNLAQFSFSQTDIKNNSNNLSPKLYDGNVIDLQLTDGANTYRLALQRTNIKYLTDDTTNRISFKYTEVLSPDNTKVSVQYDPQNNESLMTTYGLLNYENGLVTTNDYSLMFASDQLANYIAQNKNYYLQYIGNQMSNVFGGLAGSTPQGVSDTARGTAGMIGGFVGTIAKTINSAIQFGAMKNNLKNAPDQIKNASGNALFNNMTRSLGIWVEFRTASQIDIESYLDYLNEVGYNYSTFDFISNHLRTRKVFNFIQANIDGISGTISETVRTTIREAFARGVRFWHIDTTDYEQQNYETYLE